METMLGMSTEPAIVDPADRHSSDLNVALRKGVTEIAGLLDPGRSLTIDDGWREVADTALSLLRRYA